MRRHHQAPRTLIKQAEVEALRCRNALAGGSPKSFWKWRLGRWLRELESAAAVVRACLAEVEATEEREVGT